MTLADLRIGVPARITRITTHSGVVHRLMEMGLVREALVAVIKVAPFGDPIALRVGDYTLSIRRADARCFEVEPAR